MTVDEALAQGLGFQQAGKLAEAERLYRAVLATAPDHPAALARLAGIALATGHADAALRLAERSVNVEPAAEGYTTLGSALRTLARLPEGEAAFRAAVAMADHEPAAHCNLGAVLWEQKKLDEARRAYERALELQPQMTPALHGVMNVAGDQGEFEVAAAAGRRAAALGHDTASFWSDFAIALHEVGDLGGAIRAAERAALLEPQNHTLRFNLSQLLLLDGQFARGWREQEFRWGSQRFPSPARNFAQPMWDGSTGDKTVLLHAEQGLGDAIMFARYIPLAAERVRVIVECQAEAKRLIETVPGAQRVIGRGEDLDQFDAQVPFLSLPLIFNTELQSIPARVPYVTAPTDRTAAWRERLEREAGNDFRVGIAWAGSPTHVNDVNRSMSFDALAPLSGAPGVRFVSLQKGPRALDAAGAGWLIDPTAELADLADTAALIENLDLVISVDTSVVHVAGALGKRVWVMLPYAPDWRWLASRPDDSPWYPTMRLFRQDRPRDWSGVVRRAIDALHQALAARRGSMTERGEMR